MVERRVTKVIQFKSGDELILYSDGSQEYLVKSLQKGKCLVKSIRFPNGGIRKFYSNGNEEYQPTENYKKCLSKLQEQHDKLQRKLYIKSQKETEDRVFLLLQKVWNFIEVKEGKNKS